MVEESISERVDYDSPPFGVDDADADPMLQWRRWYADAVAADCVEPNAFALSTVDAAGHPQSRNVLLRSADDNELTFFTNYESAKSIQLGDDPHVALLFSWLTLHRQVRITGTVRRADDADSDAYFASRPRGSQVGAWASPQSQVIADRAALEERVAKFEAVFDGTADIPRPTYWGGWVVTPTEFEFWQGRPNRLHDRLRYRADGTRWQIDRLAP